MSFETILRFCDEAQHFYLQISLSSSKKITRLSNQLWWAIATIIALWVLLLFALGLRGAAQTARVWNVPWDCQTIQACVVKARAGDNITISPGTYVENVKIAKRDITLQGADPKRVILQAKDPTQPTLSLTRDAKGVTIQRLSIRGGKQGIELDRTMNVRLSNLIITGSEGSGLVLQDVYQFEMKDSEISRHRASGLQISTRSDRILLEHVLITNNEHNGFELTDARAELRHSVLRENKNCGIFLDALSILNGSENAALRNGNSDVCAPEGRQLAEDFWDQTPPAPPAQLRLSPTAWTNQPITVDWSNPQGPSEIGAFWYKIGSPPKDPEDGTRMSISEKPLVLRSLPEGRQSLFVWLEDVKGKKDYMQRSQAIYFYDHTPPLVTAEPETPPNSEGWYDSFVTVRFQGEDSLSGVARCSRSITTNAEGQNLPVQGECVDRAGNHGTQTVYVNVDRTSPTGSLLINEGARATLTQDVMLRLRVYDDLSGLAQVRFSNDGTTTWSDWEEFSPTRAWHLARYGGTNKLGIKTVYAQIRDRAGNETTVTTRIDYTTNIQPVIDSAAPGAVITLPPGVFMNNCLKISQSLTLRGAGRGSSVIRAARCSLIQIQGDEPIEVNLEGMTLAESRGTPFNTATIMVEGTVKLSISDVRITESEGYGIGLFFDDSGVSSLTLVNSEVSDNGSTGIAGYNAYSVSLKNANILRNGGRGIDITSRTLTVEKSEISQNEAAGLFLSSGTIRIASSKIVGNGGGGIGSWGLAWYQLTITDSQISENLAAGISIANVARAKIWNNQILGNKGFGIALVQKPCYETPDLFKGVLEGGDNLVDRNTQANLCPSLDQYSWPTGFLAKP